MNVKDYVSAEISGFQAIFKILDLENFFRISLESNFDINHNLSDEKVFYLSKSFVPLLSTKKDHN